MECDLPSSLELKTDPPSPDFTNSEPFPFFNLPELVIDKIIKEYVPVSKKIKVLSEIPAFQQYLTRKSLWYPSSLEFYKQTNSIKTGWSIFLHDLRYLRYYAVDEINLSVTVYHFYVNRKRARVPVLREKAKMSREHRLDEYRIRQKISTAVNNFCMYNCKKAFSFPLNFCFLMSKQRVLWPQGIGWSSRHYKVTFNQCSIFDESLHPHELLLTFHLDLTVTIKCVEMCETICTILQPLHFLLCKEVGSSKQNVRPSICKSCEKGSNYIHPVIKETWINFKKTVTLMETIFFEHTDQAARFKAKLNSVYNNTVV